MRRYAICVVAVLAGLAVRFALFRFLGSSVPYITLYPAVVFAAWLGGFGPGILAALLSIAAVFGLILPSFDREADSVRALIFLVFSILFGALSEAIRRARARSERDRELLQITLASIGDAVISTDRDGKVTFLNTVAEQLTGWAQKDAMGKPISNVFTIRNERTGLSAEIPVEKVIREGAAVSLANHTVLVRSDGKQIPIEDSAAPICGAQGRVLGAVLVFRDVTARRQSEEAREKSEERLKLALDAGQIGVWDWDIVRNRVAWSDRVYQIFGVDPGAFGGTIEDFARLVHPNDREGIDGAIRASLEQGALYDPEFRAIHPQKGVVWVSTSGQVHRNETGQPVRMLGSVTDISERKHAESQLRQQWHTFDTALSNTPDFTYIFDLDGRFTYINRALLSLLEISLENAVGKNFFDLNYPPELAQRLQDQIQQVIDTRQPIRDQTPFTAPSGETGYYEYIFVPVLASDGRVQAVAGSTRDITERTKIEEALRKSEERLNFALEAGGGVGTWDYDVPRDRLYCNAKFAELFSVDPQRASEGAPMRDFVRAVHRDDRPMVSEHVQNAIRTGGEYAVEYRLIRNDASICWLFARGRGHLDEAGNPARFLGVVIDITDRKQAEEALRVSQDRLRAIYGGMYEYMGVVALDGTLLDCNPASLRFADNQREDIVGHPFWDTPWFTATPGAPDMVRGAVMRVAAGESFRTELTLFRPSGEPRTFDFSMHPIRNERGEITMMVPEGRDISDLKRAEADLKHSNDELMRVNRELEELRPTSPATIFRSPCAWSISTPSSSSTRRSRNRRKPAGTPPSCSRV